MPLVSARVQSFIVDDAVIAFANAGEDQSVFCATTVQLQGEIIGDDVANHTFEWEQLSGTPVILINPNTLFPSFVNPNTSDLEFTLYVDRGTPFETSDTVFISRRPASFVLGGPYPPDAASLPSLSAGAFSASQSSASTAVENVDVDFKVGAYSYNYPPDHTYSPIYKADDLRRIKNNLAGKYWLMRDVDMTELDYPWEPLGTPQRPFSGELQGNGFSIENLSITKSTEGTLAYSADPDYSDVVALLTFNQEVAGSMATYNEVVDLSPSQHTITYGPVAYADDGSVDGADWPNLTSNPTYLLCDGNSNRWVELDPSTDFDLGTGDFTIEYWVRNAGWNVVSGLMCANGSGAGWRIQQRRLNENYEHRLDLNNVTIVARSIVGFMAAGQWHHVAWSRSGTDLRLFIDGVQNGATVTSSDDFTSDGGHLVIGNGTENHNVSSYADLDEVRITKGTARYTTNFTPPTASFDATLGQSAGLFAYVGNGALVEEVGFPNASISNLSDSVSKGILAGSAQGPNGTDNGSVTIRNVYVEGTVDSGGGTNVGGLIGHTGSNASTLIENTYSDVTVTGGGTNVGAFAGYFDTAATYNDNFWNVTKTTDGVGSGGDAPIAGEVDSLTTAQLQVESNYTNWDFDAVWQMPELKDNIGPAELQNNIYDRVANEGACLNTGFPQGAIWESVGIVNEAESKFDTRKFIGVIIQDQNPATGGWENSRFIPKEQQSALMTPGRRHRAFTVINKAPVGKIDLKREVSYEIPNTVVPKTPTDNAVFVGATTKMLGIGSGDATATSNLTIEINNPKKITNLTEDTVLIGSMGSNFSTTSTFTLNRFDAIVEVFTDTVVPGLISDNVTYTTNLSVTRLSGATIG